MYTDEFIIRIDQLCGGGTACSEDSLCLVHDEDIIIAEISKVCNVYRRSTDVTNYYKMKS